MRKWTSVRPCQQLGGERDAEGGGEPEAEGGGEIHAEQLAPEERNQAEESGPVASNPRWHGSSHGSNQQLDNTQYGHVKVWYQTHVAIGVKFGQITYKKRNWSAFDGSRLKKPTRT